METANRDSSRDAVAPRVILIGADALPDGWVSKTVEALGCRDIDVAPDSASLARLCADTTVGIVVVVRAGISDAAADSIDRSLREHGRGLAVIGVVRGS